MKKLFFLFAFVGLLASCNQSREHLIKYDCMFQIGDETLEFLDITAAIINMDGDSVYTHITTSDPWYFSTTVPREDRCYYKIIATTRDDMDYSVDSIKLEFSYDDNLYYLIGDEVYDTYQKSNQISVMADLDSLRQYLDVVEEVIHIF